MKYMIVLSSLVLGFWAQANNSSAQNADFAKFKQEKLEGLDARISMLQQQRSCLSSANGHEDVKKCHEANEAKEKEMRAKFEAMKAQHLDEKIKRLQEEKAKLGQEKK